MIKYIFILSSILFCLQVNAQHTFFPNSGTITYERKFHLQNYLKRNFKKDSKFDVWDNMSVEYLTKSGPTEIVTKHTLKFFGEETLFETVKEEYPVNYRNAMSFIPIMPETKTYTNLAKSSMTKLLTFGDDELLWSDSIPKVKWKYTDEYRTIAGYDCRRANGVIQDSIYVVAFFTNQIAIPAGPELIQGLPGTILGVSIPELNINMFATAVQLTNDPVSATLTKKKKVVPQNKEEIRKLLRSTAYDWYDDKQFDKQMSKVFF